MPYGKGGRLGEAIDPRLMQVDYSGYADVGRTQGQAFANMGAQIGDVIKQHGENQKSIKATETTLKAMEKNFAGTPVGDQARDLLQKFYDPDMSTRDKLAIRDSINQVLQIGISGMEQQRQQQMLELKRQELGAKMAQQQMEKAPINPAQLQAAYTLATSFGYGDAAKAMVIGYETAETPEAQQAYASRLVALANEIKPAASKRPENYKIETLADGTVVAVESSTKKPTVIQQPKSPPSSEVTAQVKERVQKEAKALYDAGDDVGAVMKLNSVGIGGALGGPIATEDLPNIFGERQPPQLGERQLPQPTKRKPLSEMIKLGETLNQP